MATSGFNGGGEDNNVESLDKWPVEIMIETKECLCGWCGQVLVSKHTPAPTLEDIQAHFESCKKSKEKELLIISKERREMKKMFERLADDLRIKVDEMIAEGLEKVKAELLDVKTGIGKEMEINKRELDKETLEIKKDLEIEIKEGKTRDEALSALFWKVKVLEEGTKEKMAEVNGKVSGVAETISTVVHSVLEAKGISSPDTNELAQMKKETEALWAQSRKSERENQTVKTELEEEIARLKVGTETFSEKIENNDRDFRVLKAQLEEQGAEMEAAKQVANKTMRNQEPSPFEQFIIPMNCFNLVAHNYLFQPSFRWTIDGIKDILAEKTFELTSQMFQWNGYPVQARAKFQVKEDGNFYISLCLNDDLNAQIDPRDFMQIPQVFYMLKDVSVRNPDHKCSKAYSLFNTTFTNSLTFEGRLGRNFWCNSSKHNVADSIEIEIYVEPPRMTQRVYSYEGTVEWTIENYKRRLQLETACFVYEQESPYFYTSPNGYRVQVNISLKMGPTAKVMFLTGKFDAELELPQSFPHSITVTLVNRKNPEQSITKTIVKDIRNERKYKFKICEVEEMEKLVENDTLFCKVIIQSH